MNILLVSFCKYKLHEEEFLRPIQNIIEKENASFNYKHVSSLNTMSKDEIIKYSHIIFSGTALRDFSYFNYTLNPVLDIIDELNIPSFTICAGAQVICNYFNLTLSNQLLINMTNTYCINSSQQLKIERESHHQIYTIHSYIISQHEINTFQNRHPNINILPILTQVNKKDAIELLKINNFLLAFFHPEIKNKDLIINWIYNSKK